MSVRTLKRLIWGAALLLCTVGILIALPLLGGAYTRAERAKVQFSALNLLAQRRAVPNALTWRPDDLNLPRAMEPFTRDAITNDYRRGYEELTFALGSGDHTGLPTYFQEGALTDATLVAQSPTGTAFIDWNHHLTLHFYAPDGATIALTDEYTYAQGAPHDPAGARLRVARRTVDVIMALDDGNWRVHHWRVLNDTPWGRPPPRRPTLTATLAGIRGVNYQPRSAPFHAFWAAPNPAEVQADFARIQALGLNTVRVFVPYPLPPDAPATLTAVLNAAQRHHLRVIPTLLDGYTTYSLAELPDVLRALDVLAPTLRHPSVLAIDLKNEPDADIKDVGLPQVRTFLTILARCARLITNRPLTVGTTIPDALLARELDFVSVHSYATPAQTAARLTAAARTGRPVLLSEFGYHTLNRRLPDPHTEQEQAWHDAQTVALTTRQRVGWLTWTLYDLPTGAVPRNAAVERHLGILRADGTPKPAVPALQGRPTRPPPLTDRIRKWTFMWPVAAALLALFLLLRFRNAWPRRPRARP